MVDIHIVYYWHNPWRSSVRTVYLHDRLMHFMLVLNLIHSASHGIVLICCWYTNYPCTYYMCLINGIIDLAFSYSGCLVIIIRAIFTSLFCKRFVQRRCRTYDNQLAQISKAIKDTNLRDVGTPETQKDKEKRQGKRGILKSSKRQVSVERVVFL